MVSFTTDDVLHKRTPTFVKRQSMHGTSKDADTNEIQTKYQAVLLCTSQRIDFHVFFVLYRTFCLDAIKTTEFLVTVTKQYIYTFCRWCPNL